MKNIKRKKKITPYLYVLISFACVILVGTLLLYLPISIKDGQSIKFVDAFFTSVSATCVTGLATVNIASTFSMFGKIIIAILIEIGGLSFLTIAVFFLIIIGKKMGIGSRFMMKEALNQNSVSGIMTLIRRIICISFAIQGIFVLINFFIFLGYGSSWQTALSYSIFHTISSFNNAGFDIFGANSMIDYSDKVLLNISTMILIVLGGMGFIVIVDILNFKKRYLNFHSKVVITMTVSLIIFGTLSIKLLMGANVTWLEALFTSVSTRTAGFTTIDLSFITKEPVFVIIIVLMFVGASPCSTGGGIKTTTLFTMIIAIFYLARGKKPKAFHRRISTESILKAFTLSTLAIIYCIVVVFIIYAVQKQPSVDTFDFSLSSIVFETISAFGTVGLSVGLTPHLLVPCKLLICLTMFIGRLGPLTIVSIWNNNWMKNTNSEVNYIEERIMIG